MTFFLLLSVWPFVTLLLLLLIVWPICVLVISAANYMTYCMSFCNFGIFAAHDVNLFLMLLFLLLILYLFNLIIFAAQCMTFKPCYFCCLLYDLFDLVISAAHHMTSINFPIWKYTTWVTFWLTNVHHLDKMFKLSNCIMIYHLHELLICNYMYMY